MDIDYGPNPPAKASEHRFGLPKKRWLFFSRRQFWVTGAGSGIGRAIALSLAVSGASVVVSGRREHKLNETCVMAQDLGVPRNKVSPIPLDLTSYPSIKEAVATVGKKFNSFDGLVNNAGISRRKGTDQPLLEETANYWDRLMGTNVKGPWLLTRSVYPLLRHQRSPRVVFITSEAGWANSPGLGPYNVSKAALNSLGHSFAAEASSAYPEDDTQINILIPGEARTEMNQTSLHSPYTVVPMCLALLSHPKGGPNGKFFHRDGRAFSFGYTDTYKDSLI